MGPQTGSPIETVYPFLRVSFIRGSTVLLVIIVICNTSVHFTCIL